MDEVVVADDVRESVMAIFLIAVGAILLLSFFGMAGAFGKTIDAFWEVLLGWRVLRCRLFCSGLAEVW